MKLPKELTTVTPLSKVVALFMFISLPIIAFFFGMRYQLMILDSKGNNPSIPAAVACTEEARLCPDGSSVGRVGPNCEFAECPAIPTEDPLDELKYCGGIAGIPCPSGYTCILEGKYPDAGGTCIKGPHIPK